MSLTLNSSSSSPRSHILLHELVEKQRSVSSEVFFFCFFLHASEEVTHACFGLTGRCDDRPHEPEVADSSAARTP